MEPKIIDSQGANNNFQSHLFWFVLIGYAYIAYWVNQNLHCEGFGVNINGQLDKQALKHNFLKTHFSSQ